MNYFQEQQVMNNWARSYQREGYRIHHTSEHQIVLYRPNTCSHGWHFFWTVITWGLWLPVWIVLAYRQRPRMVTITATEYGTITCVEKKV